MKILINLILLIVASVLFIITVPIAFTWTIVRVIWRTVAHKEDGKLHLSNYLYNLALSIDQTGNALGADFWNDVFTISAKSKRYGNPDETISHVLGVNYKDGNSSKIGKWIGWVLNKLDPNHIQNAAKNEQ
jgi:hypothetical protein